jgi:hypothetical protein
MSTVGVIVTLVAGDIDMIGIPASVSADAD